MSVHPNQKSDPHRLTLPICEHSPAPYHGPSREEVLALRHQFLSPGLVTYYQDPLMLVEGYVYDEQGKRYLDAFAGIVTISVGHCHPRISEKVKAQIGTAALTKYCSLFHTSPTFPRSRVGLV